ncbi:multiple ligand-binding protein 1 [Hymenobacter sp. HDW8]|uniref:multiple ligand-binding protein 1 n=1 Tax=Hymenobacter sp. HDW8 TaxID=2714932 RepID=UPI0014078D18|nr:multiple ligand-binding protein 1 [Hymenobacter sp. HDW8]QIL77421.1 multiple ligand-binding protein 1 [Hymenobacter sp. HDW8]
MKKMLILFAAFTLTAGAAFAQTPAAKPAQGRAQRGQMANKTPEQRAEARAANLSKSLGLSAEQTEKVRQLNLAQAKEMDAVRAKNVENRQKAKAARDRHDAQLKSILTADQYAKYEQQRTERMANRKGGRMKARG